MKFANYLKERRLKAKLTQQQVADALGYTTAQYVSNWERGMSEPPLQDMPKLIKLLKAPGDTTAFHFFNQKSERYHRELENKLKRIDEISARWCSL